MSEHNLVPGEGFYAGCIVCTVCERVMLPEDAEAHSARLTTPLSVFEPSPVEPDRRESAARFEDQGGAA